MKISPDLIKQLRDQTGAGVMDAKTALEKSNGDLAGATKWLKQQGQSKADKRAGRTTSAGVVDTYLHMARVGVLVELNCETDFVAKTVEFQNFAHDIAMQVASMRPTYLNPEEVPKDVVKQLSDTFKQEAQKMPTQGDVKKIVAGKLEKFYKEQCLLKQPSIKDPAQSIGDLLTELIGKLGENIQIRRFTRYELGENLE